MRFDRAIALVVAGALALGLAGCAGLSNPLDRLPNLNPFDRGGGNKIIATRGERIPLIALNQQLEVADALRGQTFYLPDPVAVETWPQPAGQPNLWTENAAVAANFQVAFREDIGEKSSRKRFVTAPPVVADGKVFAMDAEARVSARDATTGARLWSVDTAVRTKRDKRAYGGGLAYADGRLYVTSGFRFVAALDASNGALLWRQATNAPIHSAPAVGGGRVFAIDIDNQMVAFETAAGTPSWTYQALAEPARILKASAPVVSGDAVIAAFSSGELMAFRMTNGAVLWAQTLSRANRSSALSEIRDIAAAPIVFQGDVFAGSHSGVFMSVDVRSGTPKWVLPTVSISSAWPAGDVVYIVSKAGEVICVARATGQVYWIVDLNANVKKRKDRAVYFGPVLASGRLVVASSKGYAIALDPRTGAETSRIKLKGPVLMSPVPANGSLYLTTQEGDLVAIR